MPRKERRIKQKKKELLEAAKGSGSLSSWFMKSSTGKNTTCNLPFFFTLQRHSMLDCNNNYDSDEDNNNNSYFMQCISSLMFSDHN